VRAASLHRYSAPLTLYAHRQAESTTGRHPRPHPGEEGEPPAPLTCHDSRGRTQEEKEALDDLVTELELEDEDTLLPYVRPPALRTLKADPPRTATNSRPPSFTCPSGPSSSSPPTQRPSSTGRSPSSIPRPTAVERAWRRSNSSCTESLARCVPSCPFLGRAERASAGHQPGARGLSASVQRVGVTCSAVQVLRTDM
jgi:hypothetical protein